MDFLENGDRRLLLLIESRQRQFQPSHSIGESESASRLRIHSSQVEVDLVTGCGSIRVPYSSLVRAAQMTTPGRTLCFECDRGGRDAAIEATEEPTLKRARVEEPSVVEVRLVEHIRDLDEANEDNDKHYGLFVWPSALLLSRFVAREADRLCRDKVVLELGCGTGLPSILAALCGATKVYLTDRADAADIQLNAEANIKLNKLEGRAEFIPLTWGDMHISDEVAAIFKTVDVVLAADCFYQSEGKCTSTRTSEILLLLTWYTFIY